MSKGPKDNDSYSPLTRAVQGGEPRSYPYDALTHPIVQTATYSFANTAELVSFMEGNLEREEYGRYGNPTVRAVEQKVAALEGVDDAVAFSSGMAAVTSAILALVKSDSHVVLFADCYRRTRQFVTGFLSRFGVTHTLVPPGDLDALERVMTDKTRLVISEMPTNPYQTCIDLDRLSAICKRGRAKSMIDSTFATPINLRPAEHGIDLVVHSATKYLAGHNDVLAGVVAGRRGPLAWCATYATCSEACSIRTRRSWCCAVSRPSGYVCSSRTARPRHWRSSWSATRASSRSGIRACHRTSTTPSRPSS